MVARQETEHNIGGAPTRALSPRRCQAGRSMIEMLAVLAIIGILSVAALAGLMWAMAKYRANDTIHDVHIWQLAALDSQQLYSMTSGELVLNELGEVSTHGYPMAIMVQDENVFYISVDDVPKRVCSLMLDMLDETHFVTVNDIRYEGTDICDTETDSLNFYFNKYMGEVGSICIPSCTGDERCCGNTCKQIDTCCPTPDATKCGDNDCCETKCCNGVCCPESYMTCDETTTCGCPNNMVPDADTGACKCPDDAPYYFENEGICCQSGYTPLDGECQRINCDGGPTNYNCSLNGKLCGTKCDSVGRNCSTGVCYADECPSGYPFTIMKNNWGWGGGDYYGCEIKNTDCYTSPTKTACWENFTGTGHRCCQATLQGECTDGGLCDPTVCDSFNTSTQTVTYGHAGYWGYCLFNDMANNLSNVYCTRSNTTTWECSIGGLPAYNGIRCGSCTTPPCSDCSKDPCSLLGSGVYTDENGWCCKDFEKGTICKSSKDSYVSLKKNGIYEQCGGGFVWNNGKQSLGDCFPINCPQGSEWGSIYGKSYGCLNSKTGVGCYRVNSTYECYSSATKTCGTPCQTADGQGCSNYYQEACAPIDPETGKRHCVYGKAVTETCICDTDRTLTVGELCCAPGQENINGACSVVQ